MILYVIIIMFVYIISRIMLLSYSLLPVGLYKYIVYIESSKCTPVSACRRIIIVFRHTHASCKPGMNTRGLYRDDPPSFNVKSVKRTRDFVHRETNEIQTPVLYIIFQGWPTSRSRLTGRHAFESIPTLSHFLEFFNYQNKPSIFFFS